MAKPLAILMVCLGNICRSPTAEGILHAHLAAEGLLDQVMLDSAGTSGMHEGSPPDTRSIACAKQYGVDISTLRARPLRENDFFVFDVILCADQSVLQETKRRQPQASSAQVALLLAWAGQGEKPVPDPYYGDQRDFEHTYSLIDQACKTIVTRLQQAQRSPA